MVAPDGEFVLERGRERERERERESILGRCIQSYSIAQNNLGLFSTCGDVTSQPMYVDSC